MKNYTVLVLRPDYLADPYGEDTYMAHVAAEEVSEAQHLACKEANLVDTPVLSSDHDPDSAGDYFVLAVFEGHLADLKE